MLQERDGNGYDGVAYRVLCAVPVPQRLGRYPQFLHHRVPRVRLR